MPAIKLNLFILYVSNQEKSRDFYRRVLDSEPSLDVPGMTEFDLGDGTKLGLMPEAGIKRLLGDALPEPVGGPRAELYLSVEDAAAWHARALEAGASELSPLKARDWGEEVAYSQDPDGHVLAFGH